MGDAEVIVVTDLPIVPWKNGGGTTREIACAQGPNGFAWRLSVADVETEGAFSYFPGKSRILTVIEGDGLVLRSPTKAHNVLPFTPFAFSGDIDIRSELGHGPIRDFNVIFDPQEISADACVVCGPTDNGIGRGTAGICVVFALEGQCHCGDILLEKGTCALFKDSAIDLRLAGSSKALCVQLIAVKQKVSTRAL